MKQLTCKPQLIGKTISDVVDLDIGDFLAFKFTDGTFCVIQGEFSYDCKDISISDDFEDHWNVPLGIMTQEQYETMMELQRQSLAKKQAAQAKVKEMIEYKRLKAIYGEVVGDE